LLEGRGSEVKRERPNEQIAYSIGEKRVQGELPVKNVGVGIIRWVNQLRKVVMPRLRHGGNPEAKKKEKEVRRRKTFQNEGKKGSAAFLSEQGKKDSQQAPAAVEWNIKINTQEKKLQIRHWTRL